MQCWARLPPAVLGPIVLGKGVETGPTTTHFNPTCTQIIPLLPGFDHIPMASRAITRGYDREV